MEKWKKKYYDKGFFHCLWVNVLHFKFLSPIYKKNSPPPPGVILENIHLWKKAIANIQSISSLPRNESVDHDFAGLSDPVSSAERLDVIVRIPVGVVDDYSVSCRQVNSKTASPAWYIIYKGKEK